MRKVSGLLPGFIALFLLFSACAAGGAKTSGEFQGTGRGNNGDITVNVHLDAGKISDIQITEHKETPVISDSAIEKIPALIIQHQTLAVDAISGATNTSKGILAAVEAALTKAGVNSSDFKKPAAAAQAVYKDTNADAVVIGAGGAGMMTAIRLKEAGKNVILLEKRDIPGGATSLAASYFIAVDTSIQKAAGLTVTIDDYIKQTAKRSPNMNLENLRTMLDKAQGNIDWLRARGVDLSRSMSYYQVGIGDGSSLGLPIVRAMKEEVEKLKIDLRLSNRAVDIIMENGKAAGVKVETQGGSYTIRSPHVVITTGGFAANPEMVARYAPEWAGVRNTSASGSTGDGFVLAEKAGAALGAMNVVRLNPSVYSNDFTSVSVSTCRANGGIMVNTEGNRFCDDYYPDYTQLSKWIREQPGDHVFVVFDQQAMDNSLRVREFYEQGFYLKGETVEELAAQMKVPAENLKTTIEKYHRVFDTKRDEEFGRTTAINIRLDKAPYYAVECAPGIQVTLGGINVNNKMQALGADGKVIPGLYAAGECANDGLFGGGPVNINMTFGTVTANTILAEMSGR